MAKYTVKKGDTLSGIAKKFGTTVAAIMAENPIIKDKNIIRTGWVLSIGENVQEGPETVPPIDNSSTIIQLVNKCYAALEKLPEYQKLEAMLNDSNR